MSSPLNLTEIRKYVIELTSKAGEILKGYFLSENFKHISKGGVDFLTQADQEVDEFLVKNLKKQYSGTDFLTEETAPADYSHFRQLDYVWIIDPLDGTVNFSRGNPNFTISIGLVKKGKSILGVIYLPIENKVYWAQEDLDGAFLNGKPIKVSKTADLKETVIGCDWGWNIEKRLIVASWLSLIVTHVRQVKSLGSASSELASLAAGQMDVYIHSGLKPWDVAASVLLIEKAGGRITTATGEGYNIFNPDLVASNGILHEEVLKLINE
ncbi:inositol monophosphatase [Candidatus Microgenomates bacterium]|nr:inositol monophosphatase [Candidatus Microgenomates bacterium]